MPREILRCADSAQDDGHICKTYLSGTALNIFFQESPQFFLGSHFGGDSYVAAAFHEVATKAPVLNAFRAPLAIKSLPDPALDTREVIVDIVGTGYALDVFCGAWDSLLELTGGGGLHLCGP